MLPKNISLTAEIVRSIKQYCPEALIITATNPVDPLNYATYLAGGFAREQLLGYSINDSFRFREMLARELKVPVSRVQGTVIGEHGASQVLLFSTASVDGASVAVSKTQQKNIQAEVPNILKRYEELQAGRTAGWTCAIGLEMIVRAIVEDTHAVIPCSVVLHGEYGLQGMSMSVPVALGRNGVGRVIELQLTDDEMTGLDRTVATLRPAMSMVEKSLQAAANN